MRNIVSPLDGFASPFGRADTGLRFLFANGEAAGYGLDLTNERYFVDRVRKSFSEAATFSRASTATMVDSTGTLVTVSANEPRIGHHVWNGDSWVNKGLLHESEARANLVTYSEDFTDASWGKATLTVSSDNSINPSGDASTHYIQATSTGAGSLQSSHTLTATPHTLSFFVKYKDNAWVRLGYESSAINAAWFNIQTGVKGSIVGAGNTSSIQDFGNGWYRISLTVAAPTTSSTIAFIALSVSDGSTNQTSGTSAYIWGAQFEEGPTPSSYIPTSGSQVTRAAETLTAPSANLPWPEPVVISEELVTNGTFDTDSDWTKGTGWTISGGVALCDSTSTSYKVIKQSQSIIPNKVYQITFSLTSVENRYSDRIGLTLGGNASAGLGTYFMSSLGVTSDGTHTVLVTAGSETTNLEFFARFTESITIDNISVKEINPLALSIQMQGEMTYADEGTFETVVPVRWYLDGSNYIRTTIDTNASETGEVNIRQSAASVLDLSTSVQTAYTPDINVPFNIASRHGSTFINGAVGGTTLTANTTPTALPDLSATDLQLGYDFNGTIKQFRMWADDLGDDGLEQSTS